MFRSLVLSCLALGVALAKPNDPQPVPFSTENGDPLVPVPFKDVKNTETIPSSRAVQLLAAGSHVITSPNYPNNYPNDYRSSVTYKGDQGQLISITCDPFSVEGETSCGYDYLSINNRLYCGTGVISTITSSQLDIVFKTDGSVTLSGFSCTITVPSGGTATTSAPSTGDCRCGQRQTGRVVGGTEASVGEYPWQAGLVPVDGTRTFCGGSVINSRYVLTAAHCTEGDSSQPGTFQVLLGDRRIGVADSGEQRFSVVKIIDHTSYTSASGSGWDFSLLKLDRDITFSSTIVPVCLAEAGQMYAGATATASGFGRLGATSPQATTLQEIDLQVWSNSDCRQRWGSTIKDNMICAGGSSSGGTGVCMGDSGGPLVTQVSGSWRLIGVVSFGQPCAIANSPDVFARVTSALTWITDNTGDAKYCSP